MPSLGSSRGKQAGGSGSLWGHPSRCSSACRFSRRLACGHRHFPAPPPKGPPHEGADERRDPPSTSGRIYSLSSTSIFRSTVSPVKGHPHDGALALVTLDVGFSLGAVYRTEEIPQRLPVISLMNWDTFYTLVGRRKNGHLCAYCRTPLTPATATIDHVRPRSAGGADTAANKVLACEPCNQSKANLLPWQFDLRRREKEDRK